VKFRGRHKRWQHKRQRARRVLVARWQRDITARIYAALGRAATAENVFKLVEDRAHQSLLDQYPDIIPETIRITRVDDVTYHVTAQRAPKITSVTITGVVSI
jgi:hypothetical protein